MMAELEEFDKFFVNHKEEQDRIQDREDCVLRLTFKGLNTVSYNKDKMK